MKVARIAVIAVLLYILWQVGSKFDLFKLLALVHNVVQSLLHLLAGVR